MAKKTSGFVPKQTTTNTSAANAGNRNGQPIKPRDRGIDILLEAKFDPKEIDSGILSKKYDSDPDHNKLYRPDTVS